MSDNTNLIISILVLVVIPILYKFIKSVKTCNSPCCSIELQQQETNIEPNNEQVSLIRQLINKFTPRKTPRVIQTTTQVEANKVDEMERGISN